MTARAGIILAAGQGTRMKSAKPKVMHAVAGRPILGHVIAALKNASVTEIVVVTSAEAEDVRAYAAREGAKSVIQKEQLGTGHAAACAKDVLGEFRGVVVTTYGDMPLLTSATFDASFAAREKAGMALVAFRAKDPAQYGRVIIGKDGLLERIVEFKDASASERTINLCNAGILAAEAQQFFRWANALENKNAQREYYLTDIPALAGRDGVHCAVASVDEGEVVGVNSRAELAAAEGAMQQRLRAAAMAGSGRINAPKVPDFRVHPD